MKGRRMTLERVLLPLGVLLGLCVAVVVLWIIAVSIEANPSPSLYRLPSAAMEPALLTGDFITVSALQDSEISELRFGALVTHRWPPDPSKIFAKRLIGLPGDTLAMVSGELRRNGRTVNEPYAWHAEPDVKPVFADFDWQRDFLVGSIASDTANYRPSRNNWGPIVVPPAKYFVLGDNRDNSLDSRFWGFVSARQLTGRVRRIYFSRDPATGAIRWGRIGRAPK
jgi:signal peptidase I